MVFKLKNELNRFFINGKVVSIIVSGDIWIVWLECYAGQNQPHTLPITITNQTVGTYCFSLDSYVQIEGSMNSVEASPHNFEYQLIADKIRLSNSIACKLQDKQNVLSGIAFVTQSPWITDDSHPFKAKVYLGTSSILEDDTFTGTRIYFNMTLLRQNIVMADGLKEGDIIEFKASLVYNEEHGIQIIGKNLTKIGQIQEKNLSGVKNKPFPENDITADNNPLLYNGDNQEFATIPELA